MSEYTVKIPKITAASFTPNPADINTEAKLTVTITEETVYLKPDVWYSGELYSGEV